MPLKSSTGNAVGLTAGSGAGDCIAVDFMDSAADVEVRVRPEGHGSTGSTGITGGAVTDVSDPERAARSDCKQTACACLFTDPRAKSPKSSRIMSGSMVLCVSLQGVKPSWLLWKTPGMLRKLLRDEPSGFLGGVASADVLLRT